MANTINWYDIPAANYERAVNFYSKVLDAELTPYENPKRGLKMAILPATQGGVTGCVAYGEGYKPSSDGVMIYLNGGDDLSIPLSRVEQAGGKVIMFKTHLSDEIGYMAIFKDTEGNRVALHSPR